MNNNNIDNLVRELGQAINVPISFAQGASILTLSDGREVWLECPHDSALFIVHTQLQQNHAPSLHELTEWLSLNASPEKSKGSYISFDQKTGSVSLCVSLPVELINAELLKILIDNLAELASQLGVS
ncbi:MAG: hypothetical protein ACJAUP_001987 [Cellvibrionaceae bacterium]|jgi:hypothetical protein